MLPITLLSAFPPFAPEIGIVFWTSLIFLVLLFLLSKTAWKPIISALNARENRIAESLREAEKAHQEMSQLKSEHEKLLAQAKEERAQMLREAKEIKEGIINEAREKAKQEASKILSTAQNDIQNQKMAAITEVKNMVGTTAIQLAKQVLARELNNPQSQQEFVTQELKRISLN